MAGPGSAAAAFRPAAGPQRPGGAPGRLVATVAQGSRCGRRVPWYWLVTRGRRARQRARPRLWRRQWDGSYGHLAGRPPLRRRLLRSHPDRRGDGRPGRGGTGLDGGRRAPPRPPGVPGARPVDGGTVRLDRAPASGAGRALDRPARGGGWLERPGGGAPHGRATPRPGAPDPARAGLRCAFPSPRHGSRDHANTLVGGQSVAAGRDVRAVARRRRHAGHRAALRVDERHLGANGRHAPGGASGEAAGRGAARARRRVHRGGDAPGARHRSALRRVRVSRPPASPIPTASTRTPPTSSAWRTPPGTPSASAT